MKAARRLFLSVDSEALWRPNRYLGQAVGFFLCFLEKGCDVFACVVQNGSVLDISINGL